MARPLVLLLLLCAPLGAQGKADPGFDAARLDEVVARALDGQLNLHALLVERHGRLVVEAYRRGKDRTVFELFTHTRDFGPETCHDVRSVGKSVLGLLVGIALDQGRIRSAGAPVLDAFPECGGRAAPGITVAHLLAMSSGLEWQEGGPGRDDEHRLMWAWSVPRTVLGRPLAAAPGATFTYNSGGTALLAELLTRATGRPWTDFAQTALFEPLGIREVEWIRDVHGRPMAYTGLRIRPRDMVKLGRLVLNRGRWGDRQLVPAAWIDASLRPGLPTGFEDTCYGYHWWTGRVAWQGRELAWGAAFGNGGQRIYVVPELDLCVVTTGGAYGDLATARRLQALFRDLVAAVCP